MKELTKAENLVIQKSVELWSAINDMEVVHPDDIDEYRRDIHDIQNRTLARPLVREYLND